MFGGMVDIRPNRREAYEGGTQSYKHIVLHLF